jgi:hypothetical protein
MAGELFDEVMKNNAKWELWCDLAPELSLDKKQETFVKLAWPHLTEQARTTLTQMLNGALPEYLKEEIAQGLILDNQYRVPFDGQTKRQKLVIER